MLEGVKDILRHLRGRQVFPHQIAFILDSPLRKILITPTEVADRLHLKENSKVLEIGAGSGAFSVEVARRIPQGCLEIFDLQTEMLKKTRRKIETASLSRTVDYTQGNASHLPFLDAVFDVAFLVTVLGEVAEPQKCLQGLYRVIRPGGILSITEHLPDTDFSTFPRIRSTVEGEGFVFTERFGRPWCYTANFRRP